MLVSVIITNFNYGRFLKQSIESVLSQTYSNFELIVVDDGSSDNSKEIIESYEDRVIGVFQPNSGMSASRNAGYYSASGDVICFLDADDYYHPQKLELVVDKFIADPDCVLVSHCWATVDADGNLIGSSTSDKLSSGNVKPLLLQWGKFASSITSASAYRRSAMDKVMPLTDNMGADSYLNSSLPFYGQVNSINKNLMYYRIHGNNIRAHSDNLDRLILQREKIAKYINKHASLNGISSTFSLQRDVDYVVYRVMYHQSYSLFLSLKVIWLSLQESFALKRSFKDTIVRLCSRAICTIPGQGKPLLRLGLRQYVLGFVSK